MRPSARAGYDNVRELVGGKLLAFFDQIESKFSEIEEAKATMESVTDGLAKCFTWVKTLNGTFKLLFVEPIRNEEVYHPWVEVKLSEVSNGEDGGYPYGLYVWRSFKKDECLGLYIGRVFVGKDEDKIESIYKISVREGVFHLDIDDIGDGRLTYGMGMHLMNDCHFGEVNETGLDQNNTWISWDLSVIVKKDIEKGEELTLGYELRFSPFSSVGFLRNIQQK